MKKMIAILLLLAVVTGSIFAESRFNENTVVPFLLNAFVGFGVGSYVQGDTTGGAIGTTGELVSLGLVIAGSVKTAVDTAANLEVDEYGYVSGDIPMTGTILTAVGSIALMGVRIFEMIRPFSYEKKLATAMGAEDIKFNVAPVLTSANNMDLALNCKISF